MVQRLGTEVELEEVLDIVREAWEGSRKQLVPLLTLDCPLAIDRE
jgi:hypothetical protein